MLSTQNDSLEGKNCLVSGAGNVAHGFQELERLLTAPADEYVQVDVLLLGKRSGHVALGGYQLGDVDVGQADVHFAAFDLGEIEDETFCADTANVTVEGHDVHPGYAKDKLVNALRVAAAIIEGIDERWLPETTEGREPYLHPYIASGDVTKVDLKVLVRAFSNEKLEERENHLREVVAEVSKRFPKAKITINIEESYRNMAYKIREDPKVLDYALEAVERIGVTPIRQAIRGGTDG